MYYFNCVTVNQVTLPAIQESLSELLFFDSLKKSAHTDSQSKESRACLAYLLFVQLITIDSFPAVFRWEQTPAMLAVLMLHIHWHTEETVTNCLHCTLFCCSSPVFVLQCNMEHINQLLSRYAVNTIWADIIHVWKGLLSYCNLVSFTAKRNHTRSKGW